MNRRSFLELLSAGAVAPVIHRLSRRRIETDIVIYGAGAGGVCAGIQAARLGAEVVMIEPTVWVGGMITSAGVSALDGNKYGLGGGLVKEFRDKLLARYGSDEALYSGWVSLTCFEPHVGQAYLQDLMRPLDNLSVLYNTEAVGYEVTDPRERRIHTLNTETEEKTDVKRESGADVEPMPLDPYWNMFECSTRVDCSNPDEAYYNHRMHSWESFITYGVLPNNKAMIN